MKILRWIVLRVYWNSDESLAVVCGFAGAGITVKYFVYDSAMCKSDAFVRLAASVPTPHWDFQFRLNEKRWTFMH
jgi:hypothetical protein